MAIILRPVKTFKKNNKKNKFFSNGLLTLTKLLQKQEKEKQNYSGGSKTATK